MSWVRPCCDKQSVTLSSRCMQYSHRPTVPPAVPPDRPRVARSPQYNRDEQELIRGASAGGETSVFERVLVKSYIRRINQSCHGDGGRGRGGEGGGRGREGGRDSEGWAGVAEIEMSISLRYCILCHYSMHYTIVC